MSDQKRIQVDRAKKRRYEYSPEKAELISIGVSRAAIRTTLPNEGFQDLRNFIVDEEFVSDTGIANHIVVHPRANQSHAKFLRNTEKALLVYHLMIKELYTSDHNVCSINAPEIFKEAHRDYAYLDLSEFGVTKDMDYLCLRDFCPFSKPEDMQSWHATKDGYQNLAFELYRRWEEHNTACLIFSMVPITGVKHLYPEWFLASISGNLKSIEVEA